MTVFALTANQTSLDIYPSTLYLSGRNVYPMPTPRTHGTSRRPLPIGPGSTRRIYTIVEGYGDLVDTVKSAQPSLVVVVPERLVELDRVREALPGGRSETLTRCGEVVLEAYFVPPGG